MVKRAGANAPAPGATPQRIRRPAPAGDLRQQIGARIRRLRNERGLSQTQLGAPHLTRAAVSAAEIGKIFVSVKTLAFLAGRLRVSVSELIPDELHPEIPAPDFSRTSRRELQQAHKMAVARAAGQFLRAKGLDVRGLRPGDPDLHEPDAVFTSAGASVGIEITCVGYYGRLTPQADRYARDLWDLAGGHAAEDTTIPVITAEDLEDPESVAAKLAATPMLVNFDKVHEYAQALINQKATKTYSMPTILIVDASMHHVPLTPADEGAAIVRQLTVPASCLLARIYLRMSHNFSSELEYFPIG